MRVRGRFAKGGKLRFVSAIDLGRLWERALRKADLPIAYSEGFSPHPKVSFPDALPLGYASTGERKGDPVTVDLRPAIHQISIAERRVTVTLLHVEPPVRPSEVHLALQQYIDSPLPEPALITRVAQGVPNEHGLAEALTDELFRVHYGSPAPATAHGAPAGDMRGP